MSKSKTKAQADKVSREQAEEAIKVCAKAENRRASLTAKMEEEISRIRDKYAPGLNEAREQYAAAEEVCFNYAQQRKSELFATRRTFHFIHGAISIRTGNPAVKYAKKREAEIIKCLEEKPVFLDLLRVEKTINRERILELRGNEKFMESLKKIGIKVVQSESLYIEVNNEEIPSITTVIGK